MTVDEHLFFRVRRPLVSRILREWPYLLVLIPVFTEWLDHHRFPSNARTAQTAISMAVLTTILVSIIQRWRRRLETMATTDELTGLYNSAALRRELDYHVGLARRIGEPFSLLFIDLDNFRGVNESRGHHGGSALLAEFGEILSGATRRDMDKCFRFGGDEFVILCPRTDAAKAADETSQRIRQSVLSSPEFRECGVTVSIGVAQLKPEESARDLLRRADAALYAVKNSGKNGVGVAP